MATFLGQGATLEWNSVSVAQILSIDGPNVERAMIDTTALDSTQTVDSSTTVRYRTFAAGYADGGEVSMEVQYDNAATGQDDMWNDFQTGTSRTCKVTFSDGDDYSFTAFIRSMSFTQSLDEVNRSTITFKVTGAPEHTTG